MLLMPYRRRSVRWRYFRAVLIIVASLITLDLLSLSWTFSRQRSSAVPPAPSLSSTTERIFISSTHWNNEAILRSHWNSAVLDLVRHVGPTKVYVSIYESGSWDDSKGALRELDSELGKLGVRRTIVLDETTHADEIAKPPSQSGWVDTPRGKELRRIPYLSRLRNLTLRPLEELASEGVTFDKILFLNDVIFTIEDVKRLVATRDGDYAAACSMDFSHPPRYYDTFALRDSNGDEAVTQTFPFFRSSASRNAMIAGQAVPLQSCWNGMVVFNASPFYGRNGDDPLRFRGIPDSLAKYHLEASECCLIHVDNPLTPTHGVWMNPSVRVAYNADAYAIVNTDGKSFTGWWPSATDRIRGVWRNRLARYSSLTRPCRWKVMRRVRKWEAEKRRKENEESHHEAGTICLINEMQVLIVNGWAHL